MPGIDLSMLPPSLTRLGLHIANGHLALLNFPSGDLKHCKDAVQPIDIASMFPLLRDLSWKNGYSGIELPLGAYRPCATLSSLPLVSLTMSPVHMSLGDLIDLPSTLIHLTILCTGWMEADRTERKFDKKIGLPPSLETLDVRGLSVNFVEEWPYSLSRLRLDFTSTTRLDTPALFRSLQHLPLALRSLHLGVLDLHIPSYVILSLPKELEELRLYAKSVESKENSLPFVPCTSVYASVPRALKTMHLFCMQQSPSYGACYDELPRGIVDFCCDQAFPIWSISTSTDEVKQEFQSTCISPVEFPPRLVRVRVDPPREDFSWEELLLSATSSAASASVLRELAAVYSPVLFDMKETLSNLHTIRLLEGDSPIVPNFFRRTELLEFLKSLRLRELWLSTPGNAHLMTRMASMEVEGSSTNSLVAPNPLLEDNRSLLQSAGIHYGRDSRFKSSWANIAHGWPNLTRLSTDWFRFEGILGFLPYTLTELDLVAPSNDAYPSMVSSIHDTRAVALFPKIPRTVLYLRIAASSLNQAGVFSLLPPRIVELHVQEVTLVHIIGAEPPIDVVQLFELPTSLRRLTLPSYGIRVSAVQNVRKLYEFCACRPQLASFQLWPPRATGSPCLFPDRWRLPQAPNSLSYAPLLLRTSLKHTPEYITACLPSLSLNVAVRDVEATKCKKNWCSRGRPSRQFETSSASISDQLFLESICSKLLNPADPIQV